MRRHSHAMPFDNICKRLAEFYPRDFASWLLGEPVTEVKVEKTELSNEPIHADSLILPRLSGKFLHIEFQTRPRRVGRLHGVAGWITL
ncbi:MAG: hypothetical protein ACREAB_02005 [Blastocatellia bacterium]